MSASARPELIRPFSHKNPPNSARAPEDRSMYAARNQFTAIKRSSENITTDDIVNLKREKQNLLQERTLLKAKLARFADINRHPKDAGRNQQIANSLERQVRTLEQLTASKRAEIAQLIYSDRAAVITELQEESKMLHLELMRLKKTKQETEQELRQDLAKAGITQEAIRTQEVGDYWRQQGHDFLVSKRFDLTLHDFGQIDSILHFIDTRGVNTMHVGELENKDILTYHRQGKIAALKAARQKAAYLAEALGKKAGDVIRIVEQQDNGRTITTQSNVTSAATGSYDSFRTIKKQYSMLVRFAITD